MSTRSRNVIAVALIVVSYGLLVPGLVKPLITITAGIDFMGVHQELFRETRSILQTVRNLHQSGNDFVAGLILLFSVIVPTAKGLLLLVALTLRDAARRYGIFRFVRSISKWSMSDVFLVGVYVAYLAAKATDNLDAVAERGFYYFAAYCLVSLLALQFMVIEPPADD
jgi:paraquat-inducible protein A